MDKYPINLGKKSEMPELAPSKPGEEYFPSLHISGDESLGLPDSGLMTVRFERVGESRSEHNGKKHYDCTLDIKEIVNVKPDVKAEPDEDTGAALDRLKKEVEEGDEY